MPYGYSVKVPECQKLQITNDDLERVARDAL